MSPIACGCNQTCNCVIQGGTGITTTGTGAPGDPLVINATGSALTVTDTNSVDLTLTGTNLKADVIRDPEATNLLVIGPNGLDVPCEAVQDCVGQAMGPGLAYDDAANQYAVEISATPGNTTFLNPDGIFTPASPVTLGCGVEFGVLGQIQVNTAGDFSTLTRETCTDSADDDTFAALPGPDTEGMTVYCDAAGNLRTYPEKFTDVETANINDGFAPGITVLPFTTAAISITITNPSSQYCMCGLIVFAFIPGISGDLGTVVAMNHEIDFGIGGGFVAQTGGVMDNRGKTANSGALQRPEFSTTICLDPGETKTIQHRVRYARFTGDNGGAVLITSTAKSIRWVGTNL